MLGAAVVAAGLADAVAGTLIFTHGGEWGRVVLREADFDSAVQAADLWLVWAQTLLARPPPCFPVWSTDGRAAGPSSPAAAGVPPAPCHCPPRRRAAQLVALAAGVHGAARSGASC